MACSDILDKIKGSVFNMDIGTFRMLCFVKDVIKDYHSTDVKDYFIFINTIDNRLVRLWQHDWYYTHMIIPLDVERWNCLSTADKQLIINYGRFEYLYLSPAFTNFYKIPFEVIDLHVRNFDYNLTIHEYRIASVIQALITRYGIILSNNDLYSKSAKVICEIKYPLIIFHAKVPILEKDWLRWARMFNLDHFESEYLEVSPSDVLSWLLKNINLINQ